jgi:hypothetical protein
LSSASCHFPAAGHQALAVLVEADLVDLGQRLGVVFARGRDLALLALREGPVGQQDHRAHHALHDVHRLAHRVDQVDLACNVVDREVERAVGLAEVVEAEPGRAHQKQQQQGEGGAEARADLDVGE